MAGRCCRQNGRSSAPAGRLMSGRFADINRIFEAALKNRHKQFVIDGEAVVRSFLRETHFSMRPFNPVRTNRP
jgi:hypothetical protein